MNIDDNDKLQKLMQDKLIKYMKKNDVYDTYINSFQYEIIKNPFIEENMDSSDLSNIHPINYRIDIKFEDQVINSFNEFNFKNVMKRFYSYILSYDVIKKYLDLILNKNNMKFDFASSQNDQVLTKIEDKEIMIEGIISDIEKVKEKYRKTISSCEENISNYNMKIEENKKIISQCTAKIKYLKSIQDNYTKENKDKSDIKKTENKGKLPSEIVFNLDDIKEIKKMLNFHGEKATKKSH